MSIDAHAAAEAYYGSLPHVDLESGRQTGVANRDWATAVELATKTRTGGHATPPEVEMFWREFQQTGLTPEQYEKSFDVLALLSGRYHDRPPTMDEIVKLGNLSPDEQRRHYQNLPDPNHPELTAGDMVHGLAMAEYHAREHVRRRPTKGEVAMFHHGRYQAQMVADHYRNLAAKEAEKDVQAPAGGEPGGGQPPTSWRSVVVPPPGSGGVPGLTTPGGPAADGAGGPAGQVPQDRHQQVNRGEW